MIGGVRDFLGGFPPPLCSFHFQREHQFFLQQQNVTRQNIPTASSFCVSHEGVNLMQQFLCKPEGRLGFKTASVSKPDVFVRRNGFIPRYGQEHELSRAQHRKSHCVQLCLVYKAFLGINEEKELQKFENILHFDSGSVIPI